MKKINIFFKDIYYGERLKDFLSKELKSFDIVCKNNIDDLELSTLTITDYDIKKDYWSFKLATDKEKYQSIDKLSTSIKNEYDKNKRKYEGAKIISFVNLSSNELQNDFLNKTLLNIGAKAKLLLVDMTNFYLFSKDNSQISVDSLLLNKTKENNFLTNKIQNYYYLSNSRIPLEMDKEINYSKILEYVKNSDFEYIIINLSSYINQKNKYLLNKSDSIIFFNQNLENHYSKEKYTNILDTLINSDIPKIEVYQNKKLTKISTLNNKNLTFDQFIGELC